MNRPSVCLAVGGSDSCGGAGIQADLAMFSRIGVEGCSAVTALTAQNPDQILRIEPSPTDQFAAELQAIFSYYEVTAIKSGMLVGAKYISILINAMQEWHCACPLIVDPVMVSTSGTALLNDDAISSMETELFPLATLITPNYPEASILLSGKSIDDPVEAASELVQRFQCPVLLKGGHGNADGDCLLDLLCLCDGDVHFFEHPRLHWNKNEAHGSGCRLAATIAAYVSLKKPLEEAVAQAISMLTNSGANGVCYTDHIS